MGKRILKLIQITLLPAAMMACSSSNTTTTTSTPVTVPSHTVFTIVGSPVLTTEQYNAFKAFVTARDAANYLVPQNYVIAGQSTSGLPAAQAQLITTLQSSACTTQSAAPTVSSTVFYLLINQLNSIGATSCPVTYSSQLDGTMNIVADDTVNLNLQESGTIGLTQSLTGNNANYTAGSVTGLLGTSGTSTVSNIQLSVVANGAPTNTLAVGTNVVSATGTITGDTATDGYLYSYFGPNLSTAVIQQSLNSTGGIVTYVEVELNDAITFTDTTTTPASQVTVVLSIFAIMNQVGGAPDPTSFKIYANGQQITGADATQYLNSPFILSTIYLVTAPFQYVNAMGTGTFFHAQPVVKAIPK